MQKEKTIYKEHHKIIKHARSGDWKTDEDQFGIEMENPETGKTEITLLPLLFPIQKTGAAGAKRQWELASTFKDEIVFILTSPISDRSGWGEESFIYIYNIQEKKWNRVKIDKKKKTFSLQKLPPKAQEEISRHKISSAEVSFKAYDGKTLKLELDLTAHDDSGDLKFGSIVLKRAK